MTAKKINITVIYFTSISKIKQLLFLMDTVAVSRLEK